MRARLLVVLLTLAAGACASGGGVPRPFPGAGTPSGTPEPADSGRTAAPPGRARPGEGTAPAPAPAVVGTALAQLGVPYRLGGSDPSGFDCSGLVQWVFARNGTPLPREVRDQYREGVAIELSEVQPGDLIFFETVSRGASHVGLVIGDGDFVHAPSSNGVVRVEPYTANYWMRRFVGARRLSEPGVPQPDRPLPGTPRQTR